MYLTHPKNHLLSYPTGIPSTTLCKGSSSFVLFTLLSLDAVFPGQLLEGMTKIWVP